MKVAGSLAEYAALAASHRASPPAALVPTMGALHEGHRSLIRLARARSERVVVSIFVNPLQFGAGEDFARYPRPLADDLAVCEEEGVDLVFAPNATDLYAADRQVTVSAGALGQVLEGAARPGHFDGVLTVVLKLFHIVDPGLAVFGQKDAQQLACVQRLVTDLNLDIEVLGAPIVRDEDGLALSSRNVYLSPAERVLARNLSAALEKAADALYAASPDDFMATRTALAKQAKEAGDKALARQITALRKPTRSAWLVNLVARAEPERVTELVGLGTSLQEAQQAMDGDTLRRLSRDRRTMIDAFARRAAELGRDSGYPPPDGAIQDV